MFNTLKKVINIDSKGSDKKVTPSNDTNHANRTVPRGSGTGRGGVFAGMKVNEMKNTEAVLSTARVSQEAQDALIKLMVKTKTIKIVPQLIQTLL